jgi:hypothetical protein
VARGVNSFGHLAVSDIVGVMAEGGVGVFVVEWLVLCLLLTLLAVLASDLRSRRSESVVIEAPSGWQ